MEEWKTSDDSRRRVHRECVDVVARFSRFGGIEPVVVQWKDGRSFPIDEVVDEGQFGVMRKGRQVKRYRVRFGGHETDLFLERRAAVPSMGEPDHLVWWVYAYDRTLPGAGESA